MKITRKQLKKLIETVLYEAENTFSSTKGKCNQFLFNIKTKWDDSDAYKTTRDDLITFIAEHKTEIEKSDYKVVLEFDKVLAGAFMFAMKGATDDQIKNAAWNTNKISGTDAKKKIDEMINATSAK